MGKHLSVDVNAFVNEPCYINQRLKICLLSDYFPDLFIHLSCTKADIKYFKIEKQNDPISGYDVSHSSTDRHAEVLL